MKQRQKYNTGDVLRDGTGLYIILDILYEHDCAARRFRVFRIMYLDSLVIFECPENLLSSDKLEVGYENAKI